MDPNQNPSQPAGQKPIDNPLEVMSPGEQTIMQIARHPFGLIGLYFSSGLVVLALLVAAVLTPRYITGLTSQDRTGLVAGAVVLVVIVLIYVYIAATIYKGNRWIVTSDSITQIRQAGLFRKQTSQLSLANLEDVTFEQNSVIQTMFGFGTLKVETAGEHSKFFFLFCPKPADCARRIIAAHEQFINENPDGTRTAQQSLNNVAGYSPQAYAQTPPPAQQPFPPTPESQPPAGPLPGYDVPTDPKDLTQN